MIRLLEVLTGQKLKVQRGNLVFHRRNNISTVLELLQDTRAVKLVNISSDDIEGGNPKLTLALIWLIALNFNGHQLVNNLGATSLEKNLLQWASGYTEKYGLQVVNFHSSWSDGRAFLYILQETLPRGTVPLTKLTALPPIGRLQQAFSIARQHLSIDQLLDPEDVHTTKPDKKSILMYVMSIYHALESRSGTSDRGESDHEDMEAAVCEIPREESFNFTDKAAVSEQVAEQSSCSTSRPISTATNTSLEISGYQTAIEEVLTLLLESEDILSRDIPRFHDLEDAKAKFREHEEFMLKLSHHQRYVGSALEEGARLISESQFSGTTGLNMDEQNEIKQQMFLLNERWETLRIQAMDVQSKIHSQLAAVESRKIEDLRQFLTETEDRISRYGSVKLSASNLEQHYSELTQLKEDLEQQQKLVDSLGNLIVIVDDETQNFHDLEDKLAALGERWSHVVHWAQTRLGTVHERIGMQSQFGRLKAWINARERDLKLMESKDVSEMGDVIKRIRELEYCSTDLDSCAKQITELDVKIRSLVSSDDEFAAQLSQGNEDLIDRSDALRQIIEVQKTRLAEMGFEFSGVAEKPTNWDDYQGSGDCEQYSYDPMMSKRAKTEKTDKILDLELKIIDMLNFVDSFSSALSAIKDNGDVESTLQQLKGLLKQRIQEYGDTHELLEQCKIESDANLSVEEKQLHAIGSKYDEFVFRLEDIDKSVFVDQMNQRFRKSLTGLKLVLAELRDWFQHNGNAATVDELETKLLNMDSLSADIMETKKLCENNTDPQFLDWKSDFEQFLQSWKDMQMAIQRMMAEQSADPERSAEVEKWLEECDRIKVICGEIAAMNANIVTLNELSEKLHLVDHEELESALRKRAVDAVRDVKSKIMSQTIIVENVHHFRKEYENTESEIEKVANAINNIAEQEVDQINEKGIEIKKLEIDIISLKNFCEIITTNDYPKYTEQMKSIVAKHSKLVELYKEKRATIKSSPATKSRTVVVQIDEIEKWLNSLEKEMQPLQMQLISSPNELFKQKLKYQGVKEVCDAKTVQFKSLNETASEILIEVDEKENMKRSDSITNMVKALTKLNSYWNEMTNEIYNKAATLERVSSQLGEFRTLIAQENGYLDKLEQVLNKSLETAADAEEICEELDDLENIIRNHSSERLQKIEEIGNELIEVQFMASNILADINAVQSRWEDLQEIANTRAHVLDNAAKEAQSSESKVSYLQDWIAKVDVILDNHLENDVGIEDLPHDFQVRSIDLDFALLDG